MAKETIDTVIDLDDDDKSKGKKKEIAGDGTEKRSASREDDDDIDIEVEDDTPLEDRGRPARAPGTKSAVPTDEEIGEYTKGVQDRMRQMKWEYHEERRAKEAWERQSTAAVEYAKKVHAENARLRKLVTEGHKTLMDSTKSAGENEIKALQRSLEAALEGGDTKAAADLNAKIAAAAARVEATNHVKPITFEDEGDDDGKTKQKQEQPLQRPRISRAMQDWMDENPWFNENKRMTAFAFGVHEELIAKGVPAESPRYFKEINKAVQGTFKEYFDDEDEDDDKTDRRSSAQTKRRTNVAGVVRNSAARGNKVTLTQSELTVAKRMGISPQDYAREKQRLEQLDNG